MGHVFKYGDNIDTDIIIAARYLNTGDPEVLKEFCMRDLDAEFAAKVQPGDYMVAGENFGCGSSREHAPLVIKANGVHCVIAKSYARIFYRNAFNIGLPIFESAEAAERIDEGDEVQVDLASGLITNLTKQETYQAQPIPPFMQKLIDAGGLVHYVRTQTAAASSNPTNSAAT